MDARLGHNQDRPRLHRKRPRQAGAYLLCGLAYAADAFLLTPLRNATVFNLAFAAMWFVPGARRIGDAPFKIYTASSFRTAAALLPTLSTAF
jgi:hypothetical protein